MHLGCWDLDRSGQQGQAVRDQPTAGREKSLPSVEGRLQNLLLERLVADQVPLTMCPLSNVQLRVFDRLEDHNLKDLLDRGARVTINSDDPAYFGGYVLDNYVAVAHALDLSRAALVKLARNSIEATFLDDDEKAALLAELDAVAGG
jgi:adenosine deaminase